MHLKPSVNPAGITPETLLAILATYHACTSMRVPMTITSISDGQHSPHSLHHKGQAFDIRTHHLTTATAALLTHTIASALPTHYQVILEKTHIHVEYDPRA